MNSHFRCSWVPGYTSEFCIKHMWIQYIKLMELTDDNDDDNKKKRKARSVDLNTFSVN